jgi:hypothetical protein
MLDKRSVEKEAGKRFLYVTRFLRDFEGDPAQIVRGREITAFAYIVCSVEMVSEDSGEGRKVSLRLVKE